MKSGYAETYGNFGTIFGCSVHTASILLRVFRATHYCKRPMNLLNVTFIVGLEVWLRFPLLKTTPRPGTRPCAELQCINRTDLELQIKLQLSHPAETHPGASQRHPKSWPGASCNARHPARWQPVSSQGRASASSPPAGDRARLPGDRACLPGAFRPPSNTAGPKATQSHSPPAHSKHSALPHERH